VGGVATAAGGGRQAAAATVAAIPSGHSLQVLEVEVITVEWNFPLTSQLQQLHSHI
jgi:hypothetical protein